LKNLLWRFARYRFLPGVPWWLPGGRGTRHRGQAGERGAGGRDQLREDRFVAGQRL